MAFIIEENLDHADEALALLLQQYKGKEKIEALLSCYMAEIQELETVFHDLYTAFKLDDAVGDQLDILGKTVGEQRKDRDDDTYRIFVRARIAVNKSKGTIEELLNILRIISAGTFTYTLTEYPRASMLLRMEGVSNSVIANTTNYLASEAVAAGVRLNTQYSISDANSLFTLSHYSNALQTSNTLGFADASQTTGGHLDGVI